LWLILSQRRGRILIVLLADIEALALSRLRNEVEFLHQLCSRQPYSVQSPGKRSQSQPHCKAKRALFHLHHISIPFARFRTVAAFYTYPLLLPSGHLFAMVCLFFSNLRFGDPAIHFVSRGERREIVKIAADNCYCRLILLLKSKSLNLRKRSLCS